MARRYVRDNRGRFASVGATARGVRLRTAAGNKRATVAGKIEGAVPAGTIRPGRRSAKPEVAAPPTRLTPRQKAKRLGARPERMNQGPKVLASNPQGTIGASAPVRNMNRASRKIKGVASSHSAQMVALDVTSNRGMSTSISGTQLRRQVFKDPGKRVSRVTARAVWRDPSGSASATKAARQELLAARRAQKPRLAAKNAARRRGVDLTESAFERRAASTKKRASAAQQSVAGLDRANPANRKAFQRADALQAASDKYSAIVRKSKGGEFTAKQVFLSGAKFSTNPPKTAAQKAAATRQANKEKRNAENKRKMELARRFGG